MDIDRLAYFLTISTFVACAVNYDGVDTRSTRMEVAALKALDDGTALVTLRGDTGTFIGRVRANGAMIWTQPIPGRVDSDAVSSNDGKIAVRYVENGALTIAALALDGTPLWTH